MSSVVVVNWKRHFRPLLDLSELRLGAQTPQDVLTAENIAVLAPTPLVLQLRTDLLLASRATQRSACNTQRHTHTHTHTPV